MIPETLMVLAFGVGMMKTPTRHEGWAVQGGQVRSLGTDVSTEHEFRIGSAVQLPSQAAGYLADDRPVDPVEWLKAELMSYAYLTDGWDGVRSVPPRAGHLDDAKHFISLLPPGLSLPKPMLSPNGEVALYWRTDRLFADAVMEGTGRFSLFVRTQAQLPDEQFADDLVIDETIGATLLRAFEGVHRSQSSLQ
jgi:hypothetical protein